MEKIIFTAILIWWCLLDLTSANSYLCPQPEPDCSAEADPDKRLFAPDPKDCHYYYECIDGSPDNRTSCPSDQFYTTVLGEHGMHPPCAQSTDCAVTCKCEQTCFELGQSFADVNNCKKFKVCLLDQDGSFFHATGYCEPPTPYFNGMKCVENDDYCCKLH